MRKDFAETYRLVTEIVADMAPDHDMRRIDGAFDLVGRAYQGQLEGYHELQTLYHNEEHTLEVVLCAARLAHGLHLSGRLLGDDGIDMVVLGGLFHDIGYLKRIGEEEGTGAQFTAIHVQRSTEFARRHLADEPAAFLDGLVNVILVTDHRLPADRIAFADAQQELAAMTTGTADLVSQMGNRLYLERLLLLFFEFREANLGGFVDFDDLLEKTAAFYQMTRTRLEGQLQNLSPYLAKHFERAEGVAVNRYQESIDKNLAYLERILREAHGHRIDMLKRAGLVQRALEHLNHEYPVPHA